MTLRHSSHSPGALDLLPLAIKMQHQASDKSIQNYKPNKPSQISLKRHAQMTLFAKIVSEPALGQVTLIPPEQKSVKIANLRLNCLNYLLTMFSLHSVFF